MSLRRKIHALRLQPRAALQRRPPPRRRISRKLLFHRQPIPAPNHSAVQRQPIPSAVSPTRPHAALAPGRHSIQHLKLCPIPKPRRPLKSLPRIHAPRRPAHRAMQNTAVLHPLESRIAIEQIPHHLPRVVKILLAQIDPQPSHSRQNHLPRHSQMSNAAPRSLHRPSKPKRRNRRPQQHNRRKSRSRRSQASNSILCFSFPRPPLTQAYGVAPVSRPVRRGGCGRTRPHSYQLPQISHQLRLARTILEALR